MRLTRRTVVALAALSLQRTRVLGATNRGEGIMTQDQRPLGPLTPYIGEWSGAGVDTVGGFQERTAAGVRSTGAVGGVASGETVELPGRSVNPAEGWPGIR